jgi:hypothetical protein
MCLESDKLRKNFELAVKRYNAEMHETNLATSSVDPVEFRKAQQKQREIEQVYKNAWEAYFRHRGEHRCG